MTGLLQHFWWKNRFASIAAVCCIALQFGGSLWLSAASVLIWLIVMFLVGPRLLNRLWRPRFWLVTLIFAAGSGLLLGTRDMSLAGISLSKSGLEAGALMVIRGALIFGLTIWASKSLSGEVFLRLCRKIRLERLGTSFTLALRILPEIEERLRTGINRKETPRNAHGLRHFFVRLLAETAQSAEQMALASPNHRIVIAVVGPMGSGKTTTISAMAERFRDAGWNVQGITQPAIRGKQQNTGYSLKNLCTGELRDFALRRNSGDTAETAFAFDPTGWTWAEAVIRQARNEADILVVDEIGKLEAFGFGHATALSEPLEKEACGIWLLAVRESVSKTVEKRFGPFEMVLTVGTGAAVLDEVIQRMLKSRPTQTSCSE